MSIKEARIKSVLDTKINYERYGILSRREFIEKVKNLGMTCTHEKIRNYVAEEKERQWLARNAWNHPWGNENHPETIKYNKRKQALEEGIYKDVYRVNYDDTYFTNVTKIEYEYYNQLV